MAVCSLSTCRGDLPVNPCGNVIELYCLVPRGGGQPVIVVGERTGTHNVSVSAVCVNGAAVLMHASLRIGLPQFQQSSAHPDVPHQGSAIHGAGAQAKAVSGEPTASDGIIVTCMHEQIREQRSGTMPYCACAIQRCVLIRETTGASTLVVTSRLASWR